jgi:uncharacterized protein (DUF433 family)
MPVSTLRTWVSGRTYQVAVGNKYWEGLIRRPVEDDQRISYENLIEAYVLKAFRKQYSVKIREVRIALEYAKHQLGVDRVLLSPDLRVTRGSIFFAKLDELLDISREGQRVMPEVLAGYISRVTFVDFKPQEFFPVTRLDELASPKIISIIPKVSFGRPVIKRKAISTRVISERFNSGESVLELANDYELDHFEIEEAIRYERIELVAA